jgi:hypothetical protein
MSNEPTTCGCENECGVTTEPIACSHVGREQYAKRAAEFRDAFVHLERTETIAGGFRWYFQADSALEVQLRDLAHREHDCCRFFDFRITREGSALVWETRAPDAAGAVLEEFKLLPETLKGSSSLDTMQRVLAGAGLTFAPDRTEPVGT